MAQGTVRRFCEEKGYGFISPDEGARVTYEVVQGRKGLQTQKASKASKA